MTASQITANKPQQIWEYFGWTKKVHSESEWYTREVEIVSSVSPAWS